MQSLWYNVALLLLVLLECFCTSSPSSVGFLQFSCFSLPSSSSITPNFVSNLAPGLPRQQGSNPSLYNLDSIYLSISLCKKTNLRASGMRCFTFSRSHFDEDGSFSGGE